MSPALLEGTEHWTRWILDFLTNRPQSVRLGNQVSSTLILNTGIPQGCVLSPLLYSLFTHNFAPLYNSSIFIKYADDTTVVGQIDNNDESAYKEEICNLAAWCASNNLTLNATKTKDLIVDFRKSNSRRHLPVNINGTEVERVSSFKFLGVHISEDLTWQQNMSALVKKAQQRLYFLRSLKKSHLSPGILTSFYHCIIESILTNSITVWYGGFTVCERKALQRVVKTSQRITGTQLPAIEHLHHSRCLRRAHSIIKDSSHPSHKLFNLLPSRRRYRNLRTRTSRNPEFTLNKIKPHTFRGLFVMEHFNLQIYDFKYYRFNSLVTNGNKVAKIEHIIFKHQPFVLLIFADQTHPNLLFFISKVNKDGTVFDFLSCDPRDTTASAWISACLTDISSWMSAHQLKLNPSKTELLVIPGDSSPGLPLNAIRPLQMIQNAAARLVLNLPKFSHTTPLLRSFHWLTVAARIRFKTLMFTYKAKNGPVPSYLRDLITSRTAPRCLRSSSTA
ncbi:gastrula zinc finger protein XlCGF28.1-like [Silurus asotus]|uniref:Gastrula zinc finger protein XlCGF28.1-like n=1 Tax=Silurus asotus TaxID=30991 RepID=A0AAD5ANG6_SILAS|nr:gastrula zinc finger protein XlCGF28.1-like [Silurus asotus]